MKHSIRGKRASGHVLERAGFGLEGTLRESYWLHRRWQNDGLLGLLKRDDVTTEASPVVT
ncbi:hypothetical protein [Citrobacter amalonaticus]|uniref:hypothetical protein n=1 Tax=Citrobacter amalonaticus TaxID=35703 RepID=UPI00300CB43B